VVQPQPTARDLLQAWVSANAIFFANGTDYRSADKAEQQLDRLAALMKESGALVRVVGYTDERGQQARNAPLSQSRADKVRAALIQRGIPPVQLVALGRANAIDLAATTGPQSANRRVEFEVGFDGEVGE
jgi:OOP family OmpA-OmpF porin